ncbi:hypothetical protein HDU99_000638 [Rhizoclosmatium hyalinum]|nr:hypothetical protein HDU99_000638 [Rhizoclosmatium hyalinum]
MSAGELHSLAFKARRKRFLVEPFRLPPEKEDEKPGDAGKTVSKSIGVTSGCGTVGHNHGSAASTNSKLDF